jgi:hypothetical protein
MAEALPHALEEGRNWRLGLQTSIFLILNIIGSKGLS